MMVWRYDMYGLRRHQLAQALGSGDEKTFFSQTPTRSSPSMSIPTRSSMQHKDQRSLKIISPETLSIYMCCLCCRIEPQSHPKSLLILLPDMSGHRSDRFGVPQLWAFPNAVRSGSLAWHQCAGQKALVGTWPWHQVLSVSLSRVPVY